MPVPFKARLKLRYFKNLIIEWFSRPWSDLRGVSNSYAAKSTIFIPLIGYWIIFNENVVQWLNLAREFVGAPVIDRVSARVLWTYVALCAIALGTLIYARRCPTEVKKYGDYADYINGDGPAISVHSMNQIEKEVEKAGYDMLGAVGKEDYLEAQFIELNISRPASRAVVIACYAFGFAVLAVFSAQVFLKVIGMLYSNPFGK